jgi:hypothetical protein
LGKSQLTDSDVDILIQLPGEAVLWQKERLLNIALETLPASCSKVAWLDSDIVFENESWHEEAIIALEEYQLIQLFSQAKMLCRPKNGTSDFSAVEDVRSSILHFIDQAPHCLAEIFQQTGLSQKYSYCPGFAWAARRDVLEACGFYDSMIIGGGDKLIIAAALGFYEEARRAFSFNSSQQNHYRQWGEKFEREVGGSIGYLNQSLFHLWHGSLKDRHYAQSLSTLLPVILTRLKTLPWMPIRAAGNGTHKRQTSVDLPKTIYCLAKKMARANER